jgi:hypothetical protein
MTVVNLKPNTHIEGNFVAIKELQIYPLHRLLIHHGPDLVDLDFLLATLSHGIDVRVVENVNLYVGLDG